MGFAAGAGDSETTGGAHGPIAVVDPYRRLET